MLLVKNTIEGNLKDENVKLKNSCCEWHILIEVEYENGLSIKPNLYQTQRAGLPK